MRRAWLGAIAVVACGRVGFDVRGDAAGAGDATAGGGDATGDADAGSAVPVPACADGGSSIPPVAVTNASPVEPPDACDLGNAMTLDGRFAGLDRDAADTCPTALDANGACGCLEVDLGRVATLTSVSVWAGGQFDACGTPCTLPSGCGNGDSMLVLTGTAQGTYTKLASPNVSNPDGSGAPVLAEKSFSFGSATAVRYIVVCRQGQVASHDDVAVDYVRGCGQ